MPLIFFNRNSKWNLGNIVTFEGGLNSLSDNEYNDIKNTEPFKRAVSNGMLEIRDEEEENAKREINALISEVKNGNDSIEELKNKFNEIVSNISKEEGTPKKRGRKKKSVEFKPVKEDIPIHPHAEGVEIVEG